MEILTPHLRLIPASIASLEAALDSDASLKAALKVDIVSPWTEFGHGPLQFVLGRLKENPDEAGWWTHFVVHRAENKLIGAGGFAGKPLEDGTVEIGYEIAEPYRGRGYATEMARGLIGRAFEVAAVNQVIAHTLAETNPSTRVLAKCGFQHVAEIDHPEDGKIWRWALVRPQP